jgi:TetR/AcrR family transcriptional regulator, transcriptional repressor for nem operon
MARPKAFTENTALEKAMNTFWKKGYHNTSMQDLVDSMGINRASMYDTFGDKHQLYVKSLENYREISNCNLSKAIENEPVEREKIRIILRFLVDEALADTENKGCFFTNATLEMCPKDDDVTTVVFDNLTSMNTMLTEIIANAQAKGEIQNPSSPESLADFVQCNIGGIRILAKTRPAAQQLYGIVDNVMEVIK